MFMAFFLGAAGVVVLIFSLRIHLGKGKELEPSEVELRGRKPVLKIFERIATPEEMFSEPLTSGKCRKADRVCFAILKETGCFGSSDVRFRSRP